MTEPPAGTISGRIQAAVYGAGMFSIGGGNIAGVAVPLMLLAGGTPAYMIGLVLGARHLLPVIFSIHSGTLMDRLGPRRVMIAFGSFSAFVPLLYPLTDSVWLIGIFQTLIGFSAASCWVGAQTVVGQRVKGDPTVAGRLSFSVQIGTLISPAIAGAAWDNLGQWGAFGFMSFWGFGLLASALLLPKEEDVAADARGKPGLRVLLPDWRDYVGTLRMMLAPAIAVVVIASMLNIVSAGIEGSFFVVYLQKIGLSATLMGLLMSTSGLAAAVGCLLVARLTRWVSELSLMLFSVAGAVVTLMVTPLFDGFAALAALAVIRGLSFGFGQPLMITLLSTAAGRATQGRTVALRNTANRFANSSLPVLMGAVVELAGLELSFPIMGALTLVGVTWIVFYVRRSPELLAAMARP
jgi:MFS family permease